MLLLFLGDSIQCTRFFLPDVQLNWEPVSCSIQSTAMVEFGRSGFLLCADAVSLRSEKDTTATGAMEGHLLRLLLTRL